MAAERYEKNLSVGNTDTYTYTVNANWLGSETIASHSVTADSSLTVNSSSVDGNVIGASLTATAEAGNQVHFEWTTSGGRSDCKTVILVSVDNCF